VELDAIAKELKRREGPRDEKLLWLYSNHPFLGGPELDYVIYKAGITCPYFSVDLSAEDPFKKYCDDGFRTPTTCNGLSEERCAWHNTRFFIHKLQMNRKELKEFYRRWVSRIAERHSKEEVLEHLKKHLEEERDHRWYASSRNLLDIYQAVGGNKKEKIHREIKKMLRKYKGKITVEQQLYRLLAHYRNHLDTATAPPSPQH